MLRQELGAVLIQTFQDYSRALFYLPFYLDRRYGKDDAIQQEEHLR